MAQSVEHDCVQLLIYIKRNPSLTRVHFYDHWKNVHAPKVIPWAEKHGIRRYQQVHLTGKTVSNSGWDASPNSNSSDDDSGKLVEFDGIAMFTVPSLQHFLDAFKDPYYAKVIEPDERVLLDTEGTDQGAVAKFVGSMFDMVNGSKSAVGDKGKEYREALEELETKCEF